MHFVGPFMLKMTRPLLMGSKPQIMCSMFCHTNFVFLFKNKRKEQSCIILLKNKITLKKHVDENHALLVKTLEEVNCLVMVVLKKNMPKKYDLMCIVLKYHSFLV